MLVKHRFPQAL